MPCKTASIASRDEGQIIGGTPRPPKNHLTPKAARYVDRNVNSSAWLQENRTAVEQLLAQQYDLRGTLVALVAERDRNFRVDSTRGTYLLKVMHKGCDPALVEVQAKALLHIATRAADLAMQRLVQTQQGQLQATLRDHSGNDLCAFVVTFLPGRLLAKVRPHPATVHTALGALLAKFDFAMQDFTHPCLTRELKWDLRRAAWIEQRIDAIEDPRRRAIVQGIVARYLTSFAASLATLRMGPVHGDGNDYNLLLGGTPAAPKLALLDLGDMHHGVLAGEVAVAAAYAMMTADAPLPALMAITAGYHSVLPLTEAELAMVFPLVLTRLAVSVTNSALLRVGNQGDSYISVHEASAWLLLEQFATRDLREIEVMLKTACGYCSTNAMTRVHHAIATLPHHEVLVGSLPAAQGHVLDLSYESLLGGDDPEHFDSQLAGERIQRELRNAKSALGIGRYGEPRPIYNGPAFGSEKANGARRTRHLGIDLFAAAGTKVAAPLAAEVVRTDNCKDHLDYGGLVILRHRALDGTTFGTLYGHLAPASIRALRVGQQLAAGETFAALGTQSENGDWPPHLHCQVLAFDPLDCPTVPPGVADPDEFHALALLYPDPSPLLGLGKTAAWQTKPVAELLADRHTNFAPNLKISYRTPLAVARGSRHFLYDREGRRHLDAYNNVPHVGHCHPRVVQAVQEQVALLATNTRYLYESMTEYSRRLLAHCPPSLSVCYLLPSGSEANELALRLCRAHTGRKAMMVMEHGYHGHTTGTMDVSPYKFRQPNGGGAPDWVHESVQPDIYRGEFRGADAGARYAARIKEQIAQLAARGVNLAGYLCECLPSVGGQMLLPEGFLAAVYQAVRAHGGVCIADDVQTALGRTGSHFFGFDLAGAVPDMLVLGKPLGGGYPLGAVVTTKEIAASFARLPEFFSTFGGSTVACRAGLAVLDALAADNLQQNALATGERLLRGLRGLQRDHAVIGDVRGSGLFLGVDLVTDRESRAPATSHASYIKNRLREHRILIGTDGPSDNVLKIRPPMTFDGAAADTLLDALAKILREDEARAE